MQYFHGKLSDEVISKHHEQHSGINCSAGKLYKDSYTMDKSPTVPSGRCGLRGELTRHPGESGSVYGVSTFVDEYATWGRQLHGKKRGDVEAKKLTQHFRA